MAEQPTVFELPATGKTPRVVIDPGQGVISFSGCSVPENADSFFSPLHDRIDAYATAPTARTMVRVELSYFNSSTSKYLLDIFKQLEDLHATGATRVSMEWLHQANDLDMQEAGRDYRSLLEFPVKVLAT